MAEAAEAAAAAASAKLTPAPKPVVGKWVEINGKELLLQVVEEAPIDTTSGMMGADEEVLPGNTLLVNLQGRLCPRPEDAARCMASDDKSLLFLEASNWLIVAGSGDVVDGLDRSWRFLKPGQTAYVWCAPLHALADGTRVFGNCRVPSQAAVVYKVELLRIVQDTSRLNPYFTLQKAHTRKKMANDIYQHELLILKGAEATTHNVAARQRAIHLYKQAARDMKELYDGTYFQQVERDHPQRLECQQLMMDCYNNVVVVYMHAKLYPQALDAVELALKRDDRNKKALLRHAKLLVLTATSPKKLEAAQNAIQVAERVVSALEKGPEQKELSKIKSQYEQRQQQLAAVSAKQSTSS